jgi:glutamine cyclotransferase
MLVIAGMFIAAYFIMGLSFTPSNIGIFGDESSMKGGSGEVGLDADNGVTQSIVDEEVIELEKSEGKSSEGQAITVFDKMEEHDNVGKHSWVEDNNWWKDHAPDIDVSSMTHEQKKEYKKMIEKSKNLTRRCEKHPDDEKCLISLTKIQEKLAHQSAVINPIQSEIVTQFTIIEQVRHDETSFTQGLSYCENGWLYETTGLRGQSKVQRINPGTYDIDASVDLEPRYFGEGSTCYTDADGNFQLIAITWTSQTGFIYNPATLQRHREFKYETTPPRHEGWGITYDSSNQEFIVSDGSHFLYFWDRDTLVEKRKISVTRFDGREQNQLNELEFIDGLVCCNIWHSDHIICVSPVTGKSVRDYDMSSLWPSNERGDSENVLNGIALGHDHILLTGKQWDRMYKIKFSDWEIFDNQV